MRIGILGASGNAGRALARALWAGSDDDLVLLGRNRERLEDAAADLVGPASAGVIQGARPSARVRCRIVDAAPVPSALEGLDVLVVAAPLQATLAAWVRGALDGGCDWFDLTLSSQEKWAILRAHEDLAEARGRCLLTDGGIHPGLPGALARLAAARIGARRVRVAMRFGLRWSALELAPETVAEFATEMAGYRARLLLDGGWVEGWRYARSFDFGTPIGRVTCAPMYVEELAATHEALPDLEELGLWVAGFGAAVDYGVFPLASVVSRWGRLGRDVSHTMLTHGLRTFGDATGPNVILLEAEAADGATLRLRVESDDAYALTAAPVVATLLQWDHARAPGLGCQALRVDPERLLRDVARLGVAVGDAGPENP